MGEIINLDERVAGTNNPARLAVIIKLLEINGERNTPEQAARLAAAKRIQEKTNG
jgi:hypothetical protein